MDYTPVTHLVDYGTISMTWYQIFFVAVMYLALFALVGVVLFGIIRLIKRPHVE